MQFTYMQTPLYRYTFKNKKILNWVVSNCEGLVLNLFAGKTPLGIPEIRNDMDETMSAHYHLDALEFVKYWEDREKFGTILLDPPYSYRKSMEMYNGKVSSPFNLIKDHIPSILVEGGIVITFGYYSVSLGKKRGFEQEHLLVMSHGGAIHDTIAIKERKIKQVWDG